MWSEDDANWSLPQQRLFKRQKTHLKQLAKPRRFWVRFQSQDEYGASDIVKHFVSDNENILNFEYRCNVVASEVFESQF